MNTKPNILIVDDDETTLQVIKNYFIDGPFQIITANGGRKALEHLGNEKIDCIVTDVEMPGIGGIELLKRVNSIDFTIPVIIMTKYDNLRNMKEAWRNGAFDFVQKPANRDILLSAINLAVTHGADYNKNTPTDRMKLFWKKRRIDDNVFLSEKIESLLDHNHQLIHEVLQEFMTVMKGKLDDLNRSVEIGDVRSEKSLIHLMAGSCENVFAEELASTLRNINDDLRAGGNLTLADTKYLIHRFDILVGSINEYLGSLNAKEKKVLIQ